MLKEMKAKAKNAILTLLIDNVIRDNETLMACCIRLKYTDYDGWNRFKTAGNAFDSQLTIEHEVFTVNVYDVVNGKVDVFSDVIIFQGNVALFFEWLKN